MTQKLLELANLLVVKVAIGGSKLPAVRTIRSGLEGLRPGHLPLARSGLRRPAPRSDHVKAEGLRGRAASGGPGETDGASVSARESCKRSGASRSLPRVSADQIPPDGRDACRRAPHRGSLNDTVPWPARSSVAAADDRTRGRNHASFSGSVSLVGLARDAWTDGPAVDGKVSV